MARDKFSVVFFRNAAVVIFALTVLLGGCATDIVKGRGVDSPASPPPRPVFTDMDSALTCLGDRLRDQRLARHVIGIAGIVDATGKANVDLASYARSAGSRISARGSNVFFTLEGFGTGARQELPTLEERRTQRDFQRSLFVERPHYQVTGGIVSLSNAFAAIQKSGGINTVVLDLTRSTTTTVDLMEMSFGIKHGGTGTDMPIPTVDVTSSFQTTSVADEVGVLVTARVDGQRKEAGLRGGRSTVGSQLLATSARVAVEQGMIRLLATLFSVDMSECPTGEQPLPPTTPTLSELYEQMTYEKRVRWFQERLTALNYKPGPVDGILGPQTKTAITRASQDFGLMPVSEPNEALYTAISRKELQQGHDPRMPSAPASLPDARIQVRLNRPSARYDVESALRASVVVPQAGFMGCWLVTPDAVVPVYPLRAGRGNFATARSVVSLPGNAQRDEDSPSVTLTTPGRHALWCGLARADVFRRMPATYQSLYHGAGDVTTLRQAFFELAGGDLIAEGSAAFEVAQSTVSRK